MHLHWETVFDASHQILDAIKQVVLSSTKKIKEVKK